MANGKHARRTEPTDEGHGAYGVDAALPDDEVHAPSVESMPSDSVWDGSVAMAPNSHKAKSKNHRHRRRMSTGKKVLIGIVIAIVAILAAAGIAVALYINSINNALSLGEDADEIKGALTATRHTEPFYMLVMGVDKREGYVPDSIREAYPDFDPDDWYASNEGWGSDGYVKSDVIMLVRVDTDNSKVSLLSIPRDTPYLYDDGVIRGVNYAYATGGGPAVIRVVSDLTGLDISHYAEIDRWGLVELVDGLGGIDVNVPMSFDYTNLIGDPVHLEAGWQHLDGDQALALSGMRILYSDKQDQRRQTAARQVVEGIIGAVVSQPATQIPGTVADAAACVATDMSVGDIADMAQKFGGGVAVYTGSAPAAGAKDPYAPYDPPKEGYQWLTFVDEEGWARVMKAFTSGEDIGKVSYEGDKVHYAGQPKESWSRGLVPPEDL